MQVQVLVGHLCCRHSQPTVKITVGDMILDTAVGKERDVDVTIVGGETEGIGTCVGLEVRRERKPLDLPAVESLICKLGDMQSLTSRGVVSASGFTQHAQKKLTAKGVTAYTLEMMDGAINNLLPQYSEMGKPNQAITSMSVICSWGRVDSICFNPDESERESLLQVLSTENPPLLDANGKSHSLNAQVSNLLDYLLLQAAHTASQSPEFHWSPNDFDVEQSKTLNTPTVIKSKPAEVAFKIEPPCWVNTSRGLQRLSSVIIRGELIQSLHRMPQEFWVMRESSSGCVFGATAVASLQHDPDLLMLFMLSPHDTHIQVRTLRLAEHQQNAIRQLRLQ